VHARELNGQADSEAIQVALRQLQLLEAHLQRFLNLGKVGEQDGKLARSSRCLMKP
jgi:hypothetical protein